MQQLSVVIIYLGDDLVLLVQTGFIRVVIAWSPGSWLFSGAATFADGQPHGFARVAGLPGMHPVAQEPTTHKKGLEAGTLVSNPSALILVIKRFWEQSAGGPELSCVFGGSQQSIRRCFRKGKLCALTLKTFGLRIVSLTNPLSAIPVTYIIEDKERVRR